MTGSQPPSADSSAVRAAGRDVLSLALMDARNQTLRLLGAFEQASADEGPLAVADHIASFNARWILRKPDAPGSDAGALQPEGVRAHLLETLEATLELLEQAAEDDEGLLMFRVALWHEDLRGEQLVELAQSLGVPLPLELPPGAGAREPIGLPATRWTLGGEASGFAPAIERGASVADVPEFEIDAQPVSWSQYVEFIADGGYDRDELWQPAGWRWLQDQAQADGRRGPKHVEQIGVASGSVLQTWFGKPRRMGGSQSVVHASWWEADAYARWAGRRLATEEEWEIAAVTASRRGFRWGDVREWTAGTLQPLEGYVPDAWATDAGVDPQPLFGQARVVRGASFATRARMRHPKTRLCARPDDDGGFVGFRTCAWI